MQIKLINHSCVLVEKDDLKIICDPWIEGKVFDNGWDFIVPSAIEYDDFKSITHIWFSHEHPDHFFPPNIKKIAPEHRANITVLFQKTIDQRVLNYCEKMGFKKVIEMEPEKWYPLSNDLKAMCENYTEGDSWLALQSADMTVLNTNDCEVDNSHDTEAILKKIGGKVDILLAQFSYACWAGNKEQTEMRKSIAKTKLDIFLHQIKKFQPKYSIPIASYVWFCHQDNFYLNDYINKPNLVEERMTNETETVPVVLFPGETFKYGDTHDNTTSINNWLAAYDKIANTSFENLEKSNSAKIEDLIEESKKFTAGLKKDFGLVTKVLKPSYIYLNDYKKSYTLSLSNGLTPSDVPQNECDIDLSSESLLFCMKFPWGNDTLGVNGKFKKPEKGNYSRYYNFFRFNQLKSRGIDVNIGYLTKAVLRKLKPEKKEAGFYS